MTSLTHLAAVAVTTAAITLVARWLSRRSKPAELGEGGGRITPGKMSAVIVVIGGFFFAALGCFSIWSGEVPGGPLLVLLGLALACFMAPSLTRWHDVIWSDSVIEGPSRMFGPTLGLARTRIGWNEIVRTGTSLTSYSFVETADRRRIYWSYLYRGFGAFEGVLRLHRPDLFGGAAARRPTGTTTLDTIGSYNDRPARPAIEPDPGPGGAIDTQPSDDRDA